MSWYDFFFQDHIMCMIKISPPQAKSPVLDFHLFSLHLQRSHMRRHDHYTEDHEPINNQSHKVTVWELQLKLTVIVKFRVRDNGLWFACWTFESHIAYTIFMERFYVATPSTVIKVCHVKVFRIVSKVKSVFSSHYNSDAGRLFEPHEEPTSFVAFHRIWICSASYLQVSQNGGQTWRFFFF